MRRVLVTGISGTGKSTVLAELTRRGFETVDTDEPDWTRWSEQEDGYFERRTTNDYGKSAAERDLIRRQFVEVEPLLRATCTHELDATRSLAAIVDGLVAIDGSSASPRSARLVVGR